MRLSGFFKVGVVLVLDAALLYDITSSEEVVAVLLGVIMLYICFGGHLALLREGAVKLDRLPSWERDRMSAAAEQLSRDMEHAVGRKLGRLNLYLIPGDRTMNASAYGLGCVSFTAGTIDTADPVTLCGVLAHEVSHLEHGDAQFNRAVFASVTVLMLAISLLSFAVVAGLFFVFLLLGLFGSFVGVLFFRGTTRVTGALFRLLQGIVVVFYRTIIGLLSRRAEFRCDLYAAELGYGIQLEEFLSIYAPDNNRVNSLAEILYRSHPPTVERIGRLEEHRSNNKTQNVK